MRRIAAGCLVLLAACTDSRGPPATAAARSPDSATTLARRLSVAESVYFRGELDSAWSAYQDVLAAARAASDSISEARALTWLGLTAWHQGNFGDARRLGERALQLKLRLHLTGDLFRSYNALGLLAWNQGRLDAALALFDTAGRRAAAVGDAKNVGVAAGNSGLVRVELGEFAAARRGFETQRDSGRSANDARVEGNALDNLGMLAIRVGDPGAAIPVLQEARRRYASIGYSSGDQNALGQLGTAYIALGEPRLAIAAVDSALAEARAEGLRQEEASDLEALAEIHRGAGDYQRALDLYAAAQRIDQELDATVELGADARSEAEIRAALGDLDFAMRDARSALETHTRANVRLEMLEDELLLADLADRAGRRQEARSGIDRARALARRLGIRSARLHAALADARIADRAGDGPRVRAILAPIWSEVQGGGFAEEWEAFALRARALARIGRLPDAERDARRAVTAVERVRGHYGSGVLRTTYAAQRLGAYADLVQILLRRGHVAQAFEVSDAARGRALLEQRAVLPLDSGRRAPSTGEGALQQINQLAFKLDSVERELATHPDSIPIRRTASFFSLQLRRARGDYEAGYLHRSEEQPDLLMGVGQVSATAIQRAVRPAEAIVEYLVTTDRVIGFVATARMLTTFETALPEVNLEGRVRLAREIIKRSDARSTMQEPVLGSLYEALIAPAVRSGALRGVRRLIIVPHGALAYLPFAALRDERGYLVERYSFVSLPSAAALPVLRGSARSRGPGGAVFAPEPDRLPASAREARAVEQAMPGAHAFVGAAATEARVREALMTEPLVHIAGHGTLNAANPLFSRLELQAGAGERAEDDGRLEVHEVLDLHIASTLVFLSGCETGLGLSGSTVYARGEDFTTLAQAFLHAGARDVVATLWPVKDEGAAAFASAFYLALDRMPAVEALARAQRDLLSDSRYSAPFYWAAYDLTGGGEIGMPEQPASAVSVTWSHQSGAADSDRSEP